MINPPATGHSTHVDAIDLAMTAAAEIAATPLDDPAAVRTVAYAALMAIMEDADDRYACDIIERAVQEWEERLCQLETGPMALPEPD